MGELHGGDYVAARHIDDPVLRHVYRLHSRNLLIGVFNGEGFIGIRTKFDSEYLFTEYFKHTAWPVEDLGELPAGIELREVTPASDARDGRLVAFDRPNVGLDGSRGWYYLDTGEFSRAIDPVTSVYQPLFDYLEGLK